MFFLILPTEIIRHLWVFTDPVMTLSYLRIAPVLPWQLKSMDVFLSSALKVQHLADGNETFSPEVLALGICFLLWVCVKTWLSLFNSRQWCKAHLFLETFPWRSDLECIYVLSCGCAFLKYLADAFGLICGLDLFKGVLNGCTCKANFRNVAELPYFNL